MTQIVTALFEDDGQARAAVHALEAAGFSSNEVSIVASNSGKRFADDAGSADGAAAGATIGGLAGAGAGLLAALGMIAIPGLGPLVAAGALATTLATAGGGALAGGLVGSLIDYGMSEDDAEVYAESVRRGDTLITVRAPDERAAEARRILDGFDAVDADERRKALSGAGWSGYDPAAPAYTKDEVERERERYRL